MIGDKHHPGGNDRMITKDCYEKAHVVCTKPRVETAITLVDGAAPGRIEVLHGYERTIHFGGPYIPPGTQVTMQTTDGDNWATNSKHETGCSKVYHIEGSSAPRLLNVTTHKYGHPSCTGQGHSGDLCEEATITFPADWPWVRGARYSFCFFVPTPFRRPSVVGEWETELAKGAYVEVVQKHTDYLKDVCLRRRHHVDLFYGNGWTDMERTSGNDRHWYFDSPVEAGGTPLNRPLTHDLNKYNPPPEVAK